MFKCDVFMLIILQNVPAQNLHNREKQIYAKERSGNFLRENANKILVQNSTVMCFGWVLGYNIQF